MFHVTLKNKLKNKHMKNGCFPMINKKSSGYIPGSNDLPKLVVYYHEVPRSILGLATVKSILSEMEGYFV